MSIEEIKESIAKAVESCGDELTVQTFGEVSKANNRNAYPVAMAEKRAVSRAVLKLAGLYKEGMYGEDEMETQTTEK